MIHNNSCTEVLVVLQEECGEVIQSAAKLHRFGLDSENLERFKRELGDLQCMINLCQEYDLVSFEELEKYAELKRNKLKIWSDLIEINGGLL